MAKSVLIVGLGQFGGALATEMTHLGYDVLGVDSSETRVKELADVVTKVVQGDATSPALWRDLPVEAMDVGVVAFSANSAASVLAALLLRNAGIKRLVAKSNDELHTQLLKALGITRVVEPNQEAALRITHILGTHLEDYLGLSPDYGVARITATTDLGGMSVRRLYQSHKVTVVLARRGGRVILEPQELEEIQAGDVLVVAGKDSDLRSLPSVAL